MSLANAGKKSEHGDEVSESARRILKTALEAPIRAIVANSGEAVDSTIAALARAKESVKDAGDRNWKGFNAETNKIVDLKSAGIIDPLKVTKQAFLNAMSVASNYLMTGAAITDIPEDKKSPMGMPPGMGGEY